MGKQQPQVLAEHPPCRRCGVRTNPSGSHRFRTFVVEDRGRRIVVCGECHDRSAKREGTP